MDANQKWLKKCVRSAKELIRSGIDPVKWREDPDQVPAWSLVDVWANTIIQEFYAIADNFVQLPIEELTPEKCQEMGLQMRELYQLREKLGDFLGEND